MNNSLGKLLVVLLAVNKLFWSNGFRMDHLWLSDVLWELSEFSNIMSLLIMTKKDALDNKNSTVLGLLFEDYVV